MMMMMLIIITAADEVMLTQPLVYLHTKQYTF